MVSQATPGTLVLGTTFATNANAFQNTPLAISVPNGTLTRILFSMINTNPGGGIDYRVTSTQAITWLESWLWTAIPSGVATMNRYTALPITQTANHVAVGTFRDSMELWIATANLPTVLTLQIKPTINGQLAQLLRGSSMIIQQGSTV